MSIVAVGLGSYTTELPDGELPVTNVENVPITPLVTDNVTGAVPTSDWSSSLSYPFFNDAFSSVIFPYSDCLSALVNSIHSTGVRERAC